MTVSDVVVCLCQSLQLKKCRLHGNVSDTSSALVPDLPALEREGVRRIDTLAASNSSRQA